MKLMNLNKSNRVASFKSLKKNQTHSLENTHKGSEINCISGQLWITQVENNRDYILSTGDQFKSRVSGLIVVQAMEDAQFTINELKKIELSVYKTPQVQAEMANA